MAKLDPALDHIAKWEGGFTDHPADHGKATNWGVTQAALDAARKARPKAGYPETVSDLTKEQAADIFAKDYTPKDWDKIQDQRVATMMLDVSVNSGPARAVTLVQRALQAIGSTVTVDGKWGPKTLEAVNAADPEALIGSIVRVRVAFYQSIVERDPSQSVFIRGWLRRAQDIPVLA